MILSKLPSLTSIDELLKWNTIVFSETIEIMKAQPTKLPADFHDRMKREQLERYEAAAASGNLSGLVEAHRDLIEALRGLSTKQLSRLNAVLSRYFPD